MNGRLAPRALPRFGPWLEALCLFSVCCACEGAALEPVLEAPGDATAPTPDAGPDATAYGGDRPTDLPPIVQLASGIGSHCAVTYGGRVFCWGQNDKGQLGVGDQQNRASATMVVLPPVARLAVGGRHACAQLGVGDLLCWGDAAQGQLGAVDPGDMDVCAIRSGTTVPCAKTPHRVAPPAGVVVAALGAGDEHTCLVTEGGDVWCWGRNDRGQLGTGGTDFEPHVAALVDGLPEPVRSITGGFDTTCAIGESGALYCWGRLSPGESPTPAAMAGLDGVADVSLGMSHGRACALDGAGRMFCWGDTGPETGRVEEPSSTPALDGASAVAVGYRTFVEGPRIFGAPNHLPRLHTCAVREGRVDCWYDHAADAETQEYGPGPVVTMSGLEGVVALSGSDHSICAADNAGTVHCWGLNRDFSLGAGDDDATLETAMPLLVPLPR